MGTSASFFALTMLEPSIYQMLRGGTVVVTALGSKFILKRTLYRHHIMGIFLVVLGIGLVGVAALEKPSEDDVGSTGLGIFLMMVSLVLNGGLFISEEKIFQSHHVEPLKVTGTEGFWGLCLCLIFIPIFNFI